MCFDDQLLMYIRSWCICIFFVLLILKCSLIGFGIYTRCWENLNIFQFVLGSLNLCGEDAIFEAQSYAISHQVRNMAALYECLVYESHIFRLFWKYYDTFLTERKVLYLRSVCERKIAKLTVHYEFMWIVNKN